MKSFWTKSLSSPDHVHHPISIVNMCTMDQVEQDKRNATDMNEFRLLDNCNKNHVPKPGEKGRERLSVNGEFVALFCKCNSLNATQIIDKRINKNELAHMNWLKMTTQSLHLSSSLERKQKEPFERRR